MTLIDRFICRREGCIPSGSLTGTGSVFVTSYIVPCMRCGKPVETIVKR